MRDALFLSVITLSAFVMAPERAVVAYKVDAAQSKMTWLAKKITGKSHNGSINVHSGVLNLDGNMVKSGNVEIDMATISVEDITDKKSNADLLGHLESPDFFDVAKYPKASFVVTRMEPNMKAAGKNNYNVSGKLTIKGITSEVVFPATVVMIGNKLIADAKFNLDRTKWDIRYGSGKFFEGLGDRAINDEFEIGFHLIANK